MEQAASEQTAVQINGRTYTIEQVSENAYVITGKRGAQHGLLRYADSPNVYRALWGSLDGMSFERTSDGTWVRV